MYFSVTNIYGLILVIILISTAKDEIRMSYAFLVHEAFERDFNRTGNVLVTIMFQPFKASFCPRTQDHMRC